MADVVEAAVARDARGKSGKGLRAVLKKRKSVVGLFKRIGLDDERRPASVEARSTPAGALSRRGSSSSDLSTLSDSSEEAADETRLNPPSNQQRRPRDRRPPGYGSTTFSLNLAVTTVPPQSPPLPPAGKKDGPLSRPPLLPEYEDDDSPPDSPCSSEQASYASSGSGEELRTSGPVPRADFASFTAQGRGDDRATEPLPSPRPRLNGLRNSGNTCYLACVVQALAATNPLANFFLSASRQLAFHACQADGTLYRWRI